MIVSYHLKPSDHWALNRYVMTHDVRTGGAMAVAGLVIPLMLLVSMLREGKPLQDAAGSAGLVLVFAAVLGYPLFRFLAWTRYRAMPSHLYSMEMTLDDAGAHVRTPKAYQTIKWSAIVKVRRDRAAVYLFLSRRAALIVPIRAFATRADLDAFCNFATAHAVT